MNELSVYPEQAMYGTVHEGPLVDDPAGGSVRPQNVGQTERVVSMVGGAMLLLGGLPRGRFVQSLIGGALLYRGLTGHCHLYGLLGRDTARHSDAAAVPAQQGVKVEHSITISRPASELFSFWREVENLPRIMRHLESVEAIDRQRSRWAAKGPMGTIVRWEAEVMNEREGEMIAWRSLPGGDIDTAGSVHFNELPNDRGTAITVSMKYNPPAGKLGATVASLLGSGLAQELDEDLRRFKATMEAGEVPTIEGQPRGE